MILAMCFLPADIPVQIIGLNFYALRIVGMCALIKILLTNDGKLFLYNAIDKLFFYYIFFGSIIYILASQDIIGAAIFKSGQFVDSVVLYIVFRRIVDSSETIDIIVKTFSVCILILLPFAIFEFFTAKNFFSLVGRSSISIRHGEIRAAATFSHAILFGSFAAALFPVCWAAYMQQRKWLYLLATLSCIFFVIASSSSGPLVVLAGVIVFVMFFRWKQYSNLLAGSLAAGALFIHLARESPLWHFLYIRLPVKGGSTGWHRYQLVEAAVKDFWEWCWLGYGDVGPIWHVKYWAYTHAKFTDITNHFLLEGVRGGFLTMFLFILLCYKTTKSLGSLSIIEHDRGSQWLWWGFTVMMIAHCITFLSVAYFGQITMLLYLTIALGSFAYDELKAKQEIEYAISESEQ